MDRLNLIIKNVEFVTNYKIIESFEVDREFCKHDLTHFLDVARIMYIINLEEKLNLKKDIIYATALLHDIGRSLEYRENINHNIGAREISINILKDSNYNSEEISQIINAIISHNSRDNIVLNNLLRKADKLSRNCFMCKSYKKCKWSEAKKNKEIIL